MKIKLLSIFGIPLLFAGCIHYYPAAVSTNPVGTNYEKPVDVVSGQSSAFYIGIFGPFGNDSLQAAVEDALSFRRASSLSNVFVDRRLVCFPLCGFSIISRIDTMVYGTLVSYGGDAYLGKAAYSETDITEMNEKKLLQMMITTFNDGETKLLTNLLKRGNRKIVSKVLNDLENRKDEDNLSLDESSLFNWLRHNGHVTEPYKPGGTKFKDTGPKSLF